MVWIVEYRLDAAFAALLALLFAAAAEYYLRYRRGASGLPLFVWVLSVALLVTGILRAEHDGLARQEHLKRLVAGMAPTYAQELRRLGHERITLATPADDPVYQEMIQVQKEWLAANKSAADVYTLRPDEQGVLRFIVDSETDYDGNGRIEGTREARTEIGEPYEDVNGSMQRALAGENVFDNRPVKDRWGVWVSAYSPIVGSSGQVEAIVGVDYPADKWLASIAESRRSELLSFGFLVVLVVLGSIANLESKAEIQRRREHEVELQAARDAAQAANDAKSQFLANMSHELRTPLTAILGYGEQLREQLGGSSSPRALDACDAIQRSGEHLLGLINDLLDLSKIEAGKLKIERLPVSPRKLLADVESDMRIKAAAKALTLKVEVLEPIPETVLTDPTRLKQILHNLIGNAIKFTERGGVTVKLNMAHPSPGDSRPALVFLVIDTGIGISAEEIARLFRPFAQADASTTRRFGGTGLGLSISRHLAHLLGGEIAVTSVPGEGSTLSVTIPADLSGAPAVAPSAAAQAPRAAAPSLPYRILLAEDGPDNQRLIATLLTKAGAEVVVVEDGQQCVEAALAAEEAAEPFDLVLTDIQMPRMDGYEATRRLRAAGYPRPIVALTANAMQQDRDRCLEVGCDEHVPKPICRETLYAAIARLAPQWESLAAAPRG